MSVSKPRGSHTYQINPNLERTMLCQDAAPSKTKYEVKYLGSNTDQAILQQGKLLRLNI